MRRMTPAFVVGAFGGIRIAIGIAFAVVPQRLGGPSGGQRDTLMARSFAVRELVLGVGGLFAAANADAWPSGVQMWAALGALTDAGDLAAAVVDRRRGDPSVRASALVAGTGLAAEFWAFRSRTNHSTMHS
jgi:hypothetical protein